LLQLCGITVNQYHDQAMLFANMIFGRVSTEKKKVVATVLATIDDKPYVKLPSIAPLAIDKVYAKCKEWNCTVGEYRRAIRKNSFDQIYIAYQRRFTPSYIESQYFQVMAFMGKRVNFVHSTVSRDYHSEKLGVKHKALVKAQISTRFVVDTGILRNPKNDGGMHFEGWLSRYYFKPSYINLLGANRSACPAYFGLAEDIDKALSGVFQSDKFFYHDVFGPPIKDFSLQISVFYSPIKKKIVIGSCEYQSKFGGSSYVCVATGIDHEHYDYTDVCRLVAPYVAGLESDIVWTQNYVNLGSDGDYKESKLKKASEAVMCSLMLAEDRRPTVISNRTPFIIRRYPCPEIMCSVMDSMIVCHSILLGGGTITMDFSAVTWNFLFGTLSNKLNRHVYERGEDSSLVESIAVNPVLYPSVYCRSIPLMKTRWKQGYLGREGGMRESKPYWQHEGMIKRWIT